MNIRMSKNEQDCWKWWPVELVPLRSFWQDYKLLEHKCVTDIVYQRILFKPRKFADFNYYHKLEATVYDEVRSKKQEKARRQLNSFLFHYYGIRDQHSLDYM